MLLPAYASSTEGRASLTWRNRGSFSLAIRSMIVAVGADAADADHLDREVLQLITVEEHPSVFLQRFPVAGKGGQAAREQIFVAPLPPGWKIRGGLSLMAGV